MMKNAVVAVLAAIALASAPQAAQAAPFTGQVSYTGLWTLPDTDGFDDENEVGVLNTVVNYRTEAFLSLIAVGDALNHVSPIVYDPVTIPAGPLWTHASGVQFFLTSFTVVTQTNTNLSLSGLGYFTGAGYDDTAAEWAYSAQRSGNQIISTYSADTVAQDVSVPEPATLALLGVGLLGAGFVRRRTRR